MSNFEENSGLNYIQSFGDFGEIKLEKTLTSAVTTSWGVGWNEEFIARDLMQNFYDANRQNLDDVQVTTRKESTQDNIVVTAPAVFNLELLFYIGSEKGEESIGQYGEGFKAAAVCLLRDHNVNPIAISGNKALVISISDKKVDGTKLSPVAYNFYSLEIAYLGAALILPDCSNKLVAAMHSGLDHFLYDGNKLLGKPLWGGIEDDFAIYDSNTPNGHIFYRNLKRGVIHDIPLILIINKTYKNIETKISNDRDRKAFDGDLLVLFYKTFARYGIYTKQESMIVEVAKSIWTRGHPLISVIAERHGVEYSWPASYVKDVFGSGQYFARSSPQLGDKALQISIENLEKTWLEAGRIPLPGYFSKFGVDTATRTIKNQSIENQKIEHTKNQRDPTPIENLCIKLLDDVLRNIAPAVSSVFNYAKTSYSVILSDKILGELKNGRLYRSKEVFLAATLFSGDFACAMATYLHEHAHIFGRDGHRGFSDSLTEMFEEVVRKRSEMDEYEHHWNLLVEKINAERFTSSGEKDPVTAWISQLNEATMRDILTKLPPATLNSLRNNWC